MEEIKSKISKIREWLSIKEDTFDLYEIINHIDGYGDKIEILNKILNFIRNFLMFKDIDLFMLSVYMYIRKTIEITDGTCDNFDRILIRTTLMGFIQEYIEYKGVSQKEEIFNYLTNALGKLSLQPLIINLGLLLKPMYFDTKYLQEKEQAKEVEVVYSEDSEVESIIKGTIDKWIDSQELDLDDQDGIRTKLEEEFNRITEIYNITSGTKIYKRLFDVIIEMLGLKLTVLSLMDSVSDNSFHPVPIK